MPVDYDKDLIGSCLAKIEAQNLGWRTWFRSKNIEPYVVDYEKLAADNAGTLARIQANIWASRMTNRTRCSAGNREAVRFDQQRMDCAIPKRPGGRGQSRFQWSHEAETATNNPSDGRVEPFF